MIEFISGYLHEEEHFEVQVGQFIVEDKEVTGILFERSREIEPKRLACPTKHAAAEDAKKEAKMRPSVRRGRIGTVTLVEKEVQSKIN